MRKYTKEELEARIGQRIEVFDPETKEKCNSGTLASYGFGLVGITGCEIPVRIGLSPSDAVSYARVKWLFAFPDEQPATEAETPPMREQLIMGLSGKIKLIEARLDALEAVNPAIHRVPRTLSPAEAEKLNAEALTPEEAFNLPATIRPRVGTNKAYTLADLEARIGQRVVARHPVDGVWVGKLTDIVDRETPGSERMAIRTGHDPSPYVLISAVEIGFPDEFVLDLKAKGLTPEEAFNTTDPHPQSPSGLDMAVRTADRLRRAAMDELQGLNRPSPEASAPNKPFDWALLKHSLTINQLERTLKGRDMEIEALHGALDGLQKLNENLSADLSKVSAENERLTKELDEMKARPGLDAEAVAKAFRAEECKANSDCIEWDSMTLGHLHQYTRMMRTALAPFQPPAPPSALQALDPEALMKEIYNERAMLPPYSRGWDGQQSDFKREYVKATELALAKFAAPVGPLAGYEEVNSSALTAGERILCEVEYGALYGGTWPIGVYDARSQGVSIKPFKIYRKRP